MSHPWASLSAGLTVGVSLNAREETLDFLMAWSSALGLVRVFSLRLRAEVAAGLVLRGSTVLEVLR